MAMMIPDLLPEHYRMMENVYSTWPLVSCRRNTRFIILAGIMRLQKRKSWKRTSLSYRLASYVVVEVKEGDVKYIKGL